MNFSAPEWLLQPGTIVDIDAAEYQIASTPITLRADGPEIVSLKSIRTNGFTAMTVVELLRRYTAGRVRVLEVVKS